MSSRGISPIGMSNAASTRTERAEHAGVEHLAHLVDVGVVAPVERLHHDDVARPGGIGDAASVGGVGGERLLAQHVLARPDRGDRPLAVERRRRADVHRVDRCDSTSSRYEPNASAAPHCVGGVPGPRRDRVRRPRRSRRRRRARAGSATAGTAMRDAARTPETDGRGGDGHGRRLYRATAGAGIGSRAATLDAAPVRPPTLSPVTTPPSTAEVDARIRDWRPDLEAALRGLYGERADELATALDRPGPPGSRPSVAGAASSATASGRSSPTGTSRNERVGYMAYVDRFGGDLQGVQQADPATSPSSESTCSTCCRCSTRVTARATAATRSATTACPTRGSARSPTSSALIADLHDAGISLCVDFVLNHTSDDHEWAEAARAGFRVPPRPVHHVPRSHRARRVRGDAARDLPRHVAGELHLDRADGALGVDHVPRVPVGPQLGQPRRDGRGVRARLPPRQPRRRHPAPRRHRVHLEAARHELPEPARGAPGRAGAAGGARDRGAGDDPARRGDRRAERPRRLPRPPRGRTARVRARVPQPVDGAGLVDARHTPRRTSPASRSARLPEPPARTTWFTYVRCHDDIGWAIDDADAAAGRRHRIRSPRVPRQLLPRRLLRVVRPRHTVRHRTPKPTTSAPAAWRRR